MSETAIITAASLIGAGLVCLGAATGVYQHAGLRRPYRIHAYPLLRYSNCSCIC